MNDPSEQDYRDMLIVLTQLGDEALKIIGEKPATMFTLPARFRVEAARQMVGRCDEEAATSAAERLHGRGFWEKGDPS